jgi:hypothetical protein
MNFLDPQFAWLLWSLLLLCIWLVVYALLGTEERREMLIVSLWTSLLGLTEPLFVPAYWNPPSLFDLAQRTGFDIESLVFAFGVGGGAFALYNLMFKKTHARIPETEQHLSRHRFHRWAILSAPLFFLVLYFGTSLNPIYSAIIAMAVGGLATLLCRPDLLQKMLAGAGLFLALYFAFFLTLVAAYPGYVERVWKLAAVSGILIQGVPLEELLFALSFGFLWSSIYEHVAWRKLVTV